MATNITCSKCGLTEKLNNPLCVHTFATENGIEYRCSGCMQAQACSICGRPCSTSFGAVACKCCLAIAEEEGADLLRLSEVFAAVHMRVLERVEGDSAQAKFTYLKALQVVATKMLGELRASFSSHESEEAEERFRDDVREVGSVALTRKGWKL